MAENKIFEYNAPQFVDFNAGLDESGDTDTFFDVESDEPTTINGNKENSPNNSVVIKKEAISPENNDDKRMLDMPKIKEEVISPNVELYHNVQQRKIKKARRRLSEDKTVLLSTGAPANKIAENLCNRLDNLALRGKRRTHFEGIPLSIKEEKHHSMTTRTDTASKTPKVELRSRVVMKDVENRKRRFSEMPEGVPGKYIAMAESVLHFQKDTPPRFHTSKRISFGSRKELLKARMSYKTQTKTIPKTPKLETAIRFRPSHVPSQIEREQEELEEIKKHQVKANPLNEKVFLPPKALQKSTKPVTKAEPFHLSEVFKKPAPKLDTKAYVFTANPVPKHLLQRRLGVPPKDEIPATVPQSPAITKCTRNYKLPIRVPAITNDNKEVLEQVYGTGVPTSKVTRPKNTEVKPFSFEERDKEMLEKKEMKKLMIFEEEKKARVFKANPLPAFIETKDKSSSGFSHLDASCSKQSEEKKPFRARSPKVLRKSPFRPVLEHAHSQPLPIALNTERRKEERRHFEQKQMLHEEMIAYDMEQMAMEAKRKEEEERKRLRQEAVHKARPMPKFAPPARVKQSNLPLTEPQSPRFSKRTRQNHNNI